MDSSTMYCNACGNAISAHSRFCSHCGRSVAHTPTAHRLVRSRSDRKIAGVCAGLADYLDLDTSLVRILWVFVTFASGCFPGIIAYILAWIIIPEEPALPPVAAAEQQPVST